MGMSPVRRAFVILLVAAALVAMGLVFAQDQITLEVRSAHAAEDPEHPGYVASLVGTGLTDGNEFEVLTNGDEMFPAMLAAIDGLAAGSISRPISTTLARSPLVLPRASCVRQSAASR